MTIAPTVEEAFDHIFAVLDRKSDDDIRIDPAPGTPAAALVAALDGRLQVVPVLTDSGARIASVTRFVKEHVNGWSSQPSLLKHLRFTYDDGTVAELWAEMGDHGATLVTDGDGQAAFFTSMTSDGYFDAICLAGDADLKIGFIECVHTLCDAKLSLLTGDVDAVAIASDPSLHLNPHFDGRAAPAELPVLVVEAAKLARIYAAPVTPTGRARLGRR